MTLSSAGKITVKNGGPTPIGDVAGSITDSAISAGSLIFVQAVLDGNSAPGVGYIVNVVAGSIGSGAAEVILQANGAVPIDPGTGCTVNYMLIN